jgi:putative ABC transport system permease protein
MKTRVIAGRTFIEDDNKADHSNKVVIDDMVAARAYPNGSPVGKTLLVRNLRGGGPNAPFNDRVEIIGVVAHQRHESLATPGREGIYFVDAYLGFGGGRWVVRTTGDPTAIVPAVRAAMAEIDPKVPLSEVQPMQTFVDQAMAPVRFTMTLIAVFAAIAIVLAAVGLYGVLATIVRQRTAEIGEGMKMSLAGMVVGIAAALGITRLMTSLFVGVSPTDPLTFVAITILFTAVALVAAWVPAFRASRLDPMEAIRDE